MSYIYFCFEKESTRETEKRMKEEELEKGDSIGHQPEKVHFFESLSDLNRAVPNHLADESQTP